MNAAGGDRVRARPTAVAVAVGLVVVLVVVVLLVAGRGADPGAGDDPTARAGDAPRSSPDPGRTSEPRPDESGAWPYREFDPDLPTETFTVEEDGSAVVNGLTVDHVGAAPVDQVRYVLQGDGTASIAFTGPSGTVVEVPGWGLLAGTLEVIPTDGRPEYVVHFEVQTGAPLDVTITEPD